MKKMPGGRCRMGVAECVVPGGRCMQGGRCQEGGACRVEGSRTDVLGGRCREVQDMGCREGGIVEDVRK
jgi:hypothetical protein